MKTTMNLRNDFHNTSTTIRVEAGELLSRRRVRAIEHRLCGIGGCTCSDDLGIRGAQGEWHGLTFAAGTERTIRVVEAWLAD